MKKVQCCVIHMRIPLYLCSSFIKHILMCMLKYSINEMRWRIRKKSVKSKAQSFYFSFLLSFNTVYYELICYRSRSCAEQHRVFKQWRSRSFSIAGVEQNRNEESRAATSRTSANIICLGRNFSSSFPSKVHRRHRVSIPKPKYRRRRSPNQPNQHPSSINKYT